jgi:hypothetical protein
LLGSSNADAAKYVPILANIRGSPYLRDILYAFTRFIISIKMVMSHLVQVTM